jgi:hypothetical protein
MRIWASGAEIGTASVRVGRINASQGPRLMTEISLSWKEKIWINMIPSRKTGVEMNSDGMD